MTKTTKADDFGPLNDEQRKLLSSMLSQALMEIRLLGRQGNSEQCWRLADAIHNMPGLLWSDNVSLKWFLKELQAYEKDFHGSSLRIKGYYSSICCDVIALGSKPSRASSKG